MKKRIKEELRKYNFIIINLDSDIMQEISCHNIYYDENRYSLSKVCYKNTEDNSEMVVYEIILEGYVFVLEYNINSDEMLNIFKECIKDNQIRKLYVQSKGRVDYEGEN